MKKNTTFILTLLCFLLALYSCENAAPTQEDNTTADNNTEVPADNATEEPPAPSLDYTLEVKRAGDFGIGTPITPTAQEKGYTIEKRSKMMEGSEEPYYIISGDGEALLQVTPQFNLETEGYDDVVGRLVVISSRYKMDNNLGVGSTIEEVKNAYPNARFMYSGVGDMYYLEVPQTPVQFLLRESDFVGAGKKLEGESTVLEAADFKAGTKVSGVRMY